MNDEIPSPNPQRELQRRWDFADFLERLSASKGHCSRSEWDKFVVTFYWDDDANEIRRTVVRLGISWAYRDWPDLNCELLLDFAQHLRQPAH